MATSNTSGFVAARASEAIARGRRVKFIAPSYLGYEDTDPLEIALCDDSEKGHGTLAGDVATGQIVSVQLFTQGTAEIVLAGSVIAGGTLYAASNGRASGTGSVAVGTASEDGEIDDQIEWIPAWL